MRKTSANRRAENTSNARRYNGGNGASRGSAFQGRRDSMDPGDGRIQCASCYSWVRLRADGNPRSHSASRGIQCIAAPPSCRLPALCVHGHAPAERKGNCGCPQRVRKVAAQ